MPFDTLIPKYFFEDAAFLNFKRAAWWCRAENPRASNGNAASNVSDAFCTSCWRQGKRYRQRPVFGVVYSDRWLCIMMAAQLFDGCPAWEQQSSELGVCTVLWRSSPLWRNMPKAPQPSDQLHVGDYLVTACERETTFRICTTDFNGASWGLRAQGRNSIYEPIKRSEWMMSSISRRLICKIATVVGRCLRFVPYAVTEIKCPQSQQYRRLRSLLFPVHHTICWRAIILVKTDQIASQHGG